MKTICKKVMLWNSKIKKNKLRRLFSKYPISILVLLKVNKPIIFFLKQELINARDKNKVGIYFYYNICYYYLKYNLALTLDYLSKIQFSKVI